ncbi:MAG: winged helix-turn-helix domain-containing protein [Terriglobales bacterium]
MAAPSQLRRRHRFGPFEFDREASELRENGKLLPTTAQTLRLLRVLVERAGQLVSRQEVREELWPPETHVDFEHGINSAMRRLRQLLHDSDADPTYIATITGQGYRFIAAVELVAASEPVAALIPSAPAREGVARGGWSWALVVAALLAAWVVSGWLWLALQPLPRVLDMRAITTDGGLDLPARPATDGRLLYYLDRTGGAWQLMRSDGRAADAEPVAVPFTSTRLFDVSQDGTKWLLGSFTQRGEAALVWRESAAGGTPVQVGGVRALDALWTPDGKGVVYSFQNRLWQAEADGSRAQLLATLPSTPDWLAWSPDGRQLRFTAYTAQGIPAIWEWRPGGGARRVLAGANPICCGAWTRNGQYFLYSVQRDGIWNLWAQQLARWPGRLWPWLRTQPHQLTFQPRSSWGAFTRYGRRQVIFYQQEWHEDTARYRPATAQVLVLLPERFAIHVSYSNDGRQLAYVDTRDQSLWAADVNAQEHASNFRHLSPAGTAVAFPRWSPDGQWIAYTAIRGNHPTQILKVAARGGPSVPVLAARNASEGMANWSPDGQEMVMAFTPLSGPRSGIDEIAIVRAGRKQIVPGSDLYGNADWSPNGRWLAAVASDQHSVKLYDLAARRWQTIARGNAFGDALWSHDGYLYYQDLLAPGEPLYRYHPGGTAPERVTDFSAVINSGVHRCGFSGFAPDGTLLVSLTRSYADLFAARLLLP